jgi:hypothetical protein
MAQTDQWPTDGTLHVTNTPQGQIMQHRTEQTCQDYSLGGNNSFHILERQSGTIANIPGNM